VHVGGIPAPVRGPGIYGFSAPILKEIGSVPSRPPGVVPASGSKPRLRATGHRDHPFRGIVITGARSSGKYESRAKLEKSSSDPKVPPRLLVS